MTTAANATEIVYRSYRPGDEEAIVAFLQECGYRSDLSSWRWINQACPHGPMLIELAWDGVRVVGHYAVLPKRLRVDGADVQAGQAMQAVVHPQFRGLAVLQGLLQRVVQSCRTAGMPFFYGFPNGQIRLLYHKLFQWTLLDDLVALERPVGRAQEQEAAGDFTVACRERVEFDERYRALACPDALSGLVHVIRDPAFLNWRYGCHPSVRYQLLEACTADGELAGYAVLKRYEKGGTVYGHLIDIGLRDGRAAACGPLVAAALSLFQRQQVEIASCWALPQTSYFDTLRAMGFQATGFTTHMGYRLLDPRAADVSLNLAQWQLVMGDSDAF